MVDKNFLEKQLKDNWSRYVSNKSIFDERAKFNALYSCFENLGGILSGEENSNINKWLINNKNNFSECFDTFVNKKSRWSVYTTYKELRQYAPIENNTTGYSARLDRLKNNPSKDFIDFILVIRNNFEHGRKEFSERTENILKLTNIILETIIENFMYQEGYLEKEFKKHNDVLKNNWTDYIGEFVGLLLFLFILWLFLGGLFEKDNYDNKIYIDCRLKKNQNSIYCNGDFENQMNNQNSAENSYYQNIVR